MADVRFALRWLARSPGFAAVAVASLAIGIGFNTALFSIIDALLFRPLPVAEPERLADVYTSGAGGTAGERFSTSSYPDYLDLRADNEVFDDLIGYSPMFGALNLADRSRLSLGEIVTGNYFQMLGVRAAYGRTILPEDDAPGAPRVAMVSHRYWTRELGGQPDAVGREMKIRGATYTIVGVAPRGFAGMTSILSPDLWVPVPAATQVEPLGMHDVVPSPTGTTRLERRGDRWLFMKGRLKAGVTVERAQANLDLLMARLIAAHPQTDKDRRLTVKATGDVRFHPAADPVVVPIATGLMTAVALVLLIACANVASMLLARASGRQKEIAMRLALGATRARLVRQLIVEALVLATIGAAVGVTLAWWATRAVSVISLPFPIPLAFDLRIDARALSFTTAATLVAGLLAGLAPALKASRPSLTSELRGDASASRIGQSRWTLRDGLVVVQIAITSVLLVVSALLTRSLLAAQHASVGFQVDRLALVSVDTGMVGYSEERSRQFYDRALERVRGIAGVESAALATYVPFSLNVSRWDGIWIPDRHLPGNPGDVINQTRVSNDYFRTVGIAIVEGRNFSDQDRPGMPLVAIVNETMARRYWPGQSAVGRTFRTRGGAGPVFEIVGVSADHKVATIGEPPTPLIHVPRSQQPGPYNVVIARTHGDAGQLLRDLRRELLAIEPNLIFIENKTMEGEVAATLFPVRASAWLVSGVGLVAMMLAAVGLYGVIAYSVARRTREIGIRMALGAQPARVLGLIMRQGFTVAAVGLAAGCLLAAAAARLIARALYGVGAGDPVSWIGAAAVLLVVSAVANLIPARRASRLAPSEALRVD